MMVKAALVVFISLILLILPTSTSLANSYSYTYSETYSNPSAVNKKIYVQNYFPVISPKVSALPTMRPTSSPTSFPINTFFRRNVFWAVLNGANEVPRSGDIDGVGVARLTFTNNQVCVDIRAFNISKAIAAHIHSGGVGVAGPIIVPLPSPQDNGKTTGCVDASSQTIENIRTNPTNYYVNIHTSDLPEGAMRGQLI